ncbi:hypothetical protein AO390_16120 [Pseudomonas marginalis ICMP 11289]|nr:hypothetical protein AO390_16120 [Pseudomonas marginalis ICMP 11289]
MLKCDSYKKSIKPRQGIANTRSPLARQFNTIDSGTCLVLVDALDPPNKRLYSGHRMTDMKLTSITVCAVIQEPFR